MTVSAETRRVLITGANGQFAKELVAHPGSANYEITALDRYGLDIGDRNAVHSTIDALAPDLVINTAAYTAVDQAESERELAFMVNGEGPANISEALAGSDSRLIHISTDFIFDGNKTEPYKIDDTASPINVYGQSKLVGEQAVQRLLPERAIIVRSSWIYSRYGKNFVGTMLRLMQLKDSLSVVSDQTGAPTWARNLAAATWKLAGSSEKNGVYHYSDNGTASWFDFAQAIYTEGKKAGLISHPVEILPITSKQYPSAARRPAYSVLGEKIKPPLTEDDFEDWRLALRKMLTEIAASGNR